MNLTAKITFALFLGLTPASCLITNKNESKKGQQGTHAELISSNSTPRNVETFAPPLEERIPTRIPLWNDQMKEGNADLGDAYITIHKPSNPNGMAIIVCPGGGYSLLALEPEGYNIAKWLNSKNITAIVLEYRLPAGKKEVPLQDARRAIQYARHNSEALEIADNKIGVMGFSAGGHLAVTLGTHHDFDTLNLNDDIDLESARPDFMVLIYPVISMGTWGHPSSRNQLLGPDQEQDTIDFYSGEKNIDAATPPVFLAHAVDDKAVPIKNSQEFYSEAVRQNVNAKFIELAYGGHGLNGYNGPMWDKWQEESINWLRSL